MPAESEIIAKLVKKLTALQENAYCEYIALCRRDECLGWEAKAERGNFGLAELEAHKKAAEALGKHRAFARVAQELATEGRE